MKTIAYLGPPGTFSHEAAAIWARTEGQVNFLPCPDLPEVLEAVYNGQAEVALLPVENSIEGAVNLTLDLVVEAKELQVIREIILPVCHCLIGKAKTLGEIREVWSHPQALAQCRQYLNKNLRHAAVRSTTSTAEAVSQAGLRPELASIGSAFAASLYRLPVIVAGIQDYQENKTRFWVMGRERQKLRPVPCKTSLVMAAAANQPGSLYNILKYFAEAGINLTRIESRPAKKELGEYLFFIDCEGDAAAFPLKEVLNKLKPVTSLLQVLGSYPRDREEAGCS